MGARTRCPLSGPGKSPRPTLHLFRIEAILAGVTTALVVGTKLSEAPGHPDSTSHLIAVDPMGGLVAINANPSH